MLRVITVDKSGAEAAHEPTNLRLAIFAVGYAISATICCLLAAHAQAQFVDLHVYRLGGDAVLHGTNVYGGRFAGLPFTYPPFAAIVCTGLAALPWSLAAALLTVASAVALVVILFLALRLLPAAYQLDTRSRWMLALAAGAAAIWLEPVRTALGYGQIDVFIVAGVVYDLTRGDDARYKGAMIGMVTGLKLTPAIFVPYLLLTRRYRAAALAMGTFAATVAVGWVVLPGSSASYWNGTFVDPGHVGLVQDAENQSLLGMLTRNAHTTDITWLWLPLALIIAAAGLALAARAGRRGDDGLGFSLCAITGLLISPISWTHHWIIAIPALLLAAVATYQGRGQRPRWITVSVGLALATIAVGGWARLDRAIPGSDWLHLSVSAIGRSELYVVAGIVVLLVAAARGILSRS